MSETKSADFQFQGFVIEQSIIELRDSARERELDIKLAPSGVIDNKNKIFKLKLGLEINEPGDEIYLKIVAVGSYVFNEEIEEKMLDSFFYLNAPAILFPYLRAYISTLTTLSGIPSVNLPTLNLTGFRAELKANTKELN